MRRLVLTLVLALFSLPINAFGAPIRWTLHDVRFGDGGTASGHIVLDLDVLRAQSPGGSSRMTIDDIAVTASSGRDSAFSTRTYHEGEGLFAEYLEASDSLGSYGLITLRSGFDASGSPRMLMIYLAAPLSAAGGVVPIVISNRHLSVEYRGNDPTARRAIVGGQLVGSPVTIPEPTVMMLLAVGAGCAAIRRQRRPRPSQEVSPLT